MRSTLAPLSRFGRWVVGKRNAEGLALWIASVLYSLLILVVGPTIKNDLWLAILAAVPFAFLLHLLRFATNRLWAEHLCGDWIYVSFPDGYPGEIDVQDLGELGQPRFGLAKVSVSPRGNIGLSVDLFNSGEQVLDVLDQATIATHRHRIGILESRAIDYDTDRETLFVAYEVDYFHQERKREGVLQIKLSAASPNPALPGTWRSWIRGERGSSRFGLMELYRPDNFRTLRDSGELEWLISDE